MVRVLWLLAASMATVMASGAVAESESETGRVRVVVRIHDHAKGILDVWETVKNETQEAIDTVGDHIHDALHGSESGEQDEDVETEEKTKKVKSTKKKAKGILDVWETVKNETQEAIETVGDHIHDALHGSESGEQDEDVETEEKNHKKIKTSKHKKKAAVVKETIVVDHNVKKAKTLHGKSWLGDVLEDIKDKIFGSESGSGSAEVGEETVTEEEEEEGGEIETPVPLEELTKKHAVHKSAHHKKTSADHKNKKHAADKHAAKNTHTTKTKAKHAATAKKEQQHLSTPHPAEAVTLSKSETERSGHRMGETSFVVIGAAVGALVGVIALAVVAVVMRRRRSAATGSSEATAASQNDDDVETAAAVPVVRGDKEDESLEGSV